MERKIHKSFEDCKTLDDVNRIVDAEIIFNDKDFKHYREMYSSENEETKKSLDDFIKICSNYILMQNK